MTISKITEIGEIKSINGNSISIEISETLRSNMPIIDGTVYRVGQIGSFLKIPLGYATLYGIVTQVGIDAIPDKFKEQDYSFFLNQQWLTIILIGEQIGNKFERGITQFPTPGDSVHLVTNKDLEVIYGGFSDDNSIIVGNISASESLEARIDIDKLVSRHCAILGSTGSGKSNAVAVLLNAIANKGFKSARVLVVDPHGEYTEALKGKCNIYKVNPETLENNLFIPFWALPFNQLLEIFSQSLLDANKDYVRQKVLEYKIKSNIENKLGIDIESITADTPIPFSLDELWGELDDFERKTFENDRITECLIKKGNYSKLESSEYRPASTMNSAPYYNMQRKGILYFTDSIRSKIKDNRYSFLFNPGDYKPTSDGKAKVLNLLLQQWIGSNKPITILDLSGVPNEIMQTISGTLLKIVFDALFWGQNLSIGGKEQPILIVLEEAHNYLKAGENSVSSNTVQNIAKEGRKYGVGLMLVTQRPSELDETVLSQCGTLIALRMNNSKDRGHIKSAIQDELQTIVDLLPSLRTGEGIISGEAVKMPSRIKFFKASNAPKGSDPKASVKWKLEQKDIEKDYEILVNLWRNQQFNVKKEE